MRYSVVVAFFCFLSPWMAISQETSRLSGTVHNESDVPVEDVFVYVDGVDGLSITDAKGRFSFTLPSRRPYTLRFQSIQIEPIEQSVFLDDDVRLSIVAKEKIENLIEIVVESDTDAFGIRQLRSMEAGGLYEGKKTEVISVRKLISNKAANNARQAFSKIPSLNIWESDFAGLQLDIGGRGLSPKRTSNFNTRQNGYDISADALGYPESYYTPPQQAIEQIEVVRGAGALQYGSQFGGLVNFKMRKGTAAKPLQFISENTYGAYGFFNSFNSIQGQYKKLNHYSYLQYKRGNGWRPNADFQQQGAFTSLEYKVSNRMKIGGDFTHMYYLSKQAGGLTDEQFLADPQQSTRSRNWFRVSWTLPALLFEYEIAPNIKLYSRTFGLIAQRSSLGLLTTPNNSDPEEEGEPFANRDFIDGTFQNIGHESRVTFSYRTKKGLQNSLLVGTRLFRGFTNFRQMLGDNGSDAHFVQADTAIAGRRQSDFDFPSINAALFAEKIVRLSQNLSLIPGLRLEHIRTESDGTLFIPVEINAFDDVVVNDSTVASSKQRTIFLYGLGLSQKLSDQYELYANATANYRAINFTDVQIQTNSQQVDPDISDESGYSFDLGVRKTNFQPFFLEAGLFCLLYRDRIGEILDDDLRIRTNVGSGRIVGLELFLEADLLKVFRSESTSRLSFFVNGSFNHGIYTNVDDAGVVGSVQEGNKLEDIPAYNVKSGFAYRKGNFAASIQGSFVGEQFSDARNTTVEISTLSGEVEGFETTGVFGEIPAYHVLDFSTEYRFNDRVKLSSSVNNLLNSMYFTRRATAYPGPGIIPALGRVWNVTLSFRSR